MKANRTPRYIRLQGRISKLYDREEDAWKKYGGGNPYRYCRYCEVSNIEETYKGHHKGCSIKGIKKEIAYYQRLLEEDPSFQKLKMEKKP